MHTRRLRDSTEVNGNKLAIRDFRPGSAPPTITSGIRVGTAAATSRGFGEDEIRRVADRIPDVIEANGAEAVVQRVRGLVLQRCRRYPVYAGTWHNSAGSASQAL